MSYVDLNSVVDQELFGKTVLTQTTLKASINQAMARSAFLDSFLQNGGSRTTVHNWQDIDFTESENVSSADPTETAEGRSIQSKSQTAVSLHRNTMFSFIDLADELNYLDDAAGTITSRLSDYWSYRLQAMGKAFVAGAVANNVANDGSDFLFDISGAEYTDKVTNMTFANFNLALATFGEQKSVLDTIVMHPNVETDLINADQIVRSVDPRSGASINTYNGRRVVLSENLPVNDGVYDSWLMKSGTIQYGLAVPKNAFATERDEAAANGGGVESLHSRIKIALSMTGHSFTGTDNPENSVLSAAGSHERVVNERRQCPFVVIRSRQADPSV